MDIRDKMSEGFKDVKGGLFEKVFKADVGTALDELIANGASLMCWADAFIPDPAIPEHIKQATIKGIQDGTSAHYTKPIGNSELKEEIAKKLKIVNNLEVDPQRNILITPGSDSGLMYAMMPFINPGDEVMVIDPSYPNNFLNPKLLGGITVPVPLFEENNYQIDIAEFESRLTDKTKMIVLTNPNNPTTTVLRTECLKKLADFAIKNDLVVVCDQAFEDFIFDDIEFTTIASLPGMWERTVTVCSFSKGMILSGYRVGYIVADDKVMDVLFGCAVSVIGATNTAAQLGAIAGLQNSDFLKEYYEIFERRRNIVFDILSSVPGVKMKKSESTFMSWINIEQLGTSDEVNAYIIKHANVVCNAGANYGSQGEGHLRIIHGAYQDESKMVDAINRIKAALIQLAVEKGIAE